LSYSVWDGKNDVQNGGNLVMVFKNGRTDAEAFRQHLDYAVKSVPMNTIAVLPATPGVKEFPEPTLASEYDPLQDYLHEMGAWLQTHGWLDRACIEAMPVAAVIAPLEFTWN